MLELVFMLLGGHALADYPLQGDFLAKAKNRRAPLPGVPWYWAMGSHALIHGLFVAVLTGSVKLGMAEVVLHVIIDDLKCTGRIGFNTDQLLHIGCKLLWAAIATSMIVVPNLI